MFLYSRQTENIIVLFSKKMSLKSKIFCTLCVVSCLLSVVLIGLRTSTFKYSDENLRQAWKRTIGYRNLVETSENLNKTQNAADVEIVLKENVNRTGNVASKLNNKEQKKVKDTKEKKNPDKIITKNLSSNGNISLERRKKEVVLSKTALPITGLVSFPGSGNTWTRHLIQQMTVSKNTFEKWLTWYVNLTKYTVEKFKGPVHVLQYERLKTDMAYELRKLASFFNLSVSNNDIKCTVKLQEGNFHRRTNETSHMELLRSVYTKENLLKLKMAARLSEKLVKDAYNIDIDLGGTIEKVLLRDSPDKTFV